VRGARRGLGEQNENHSEKKKEQTRVKEHQEVSIVAVK